jgi:nucleoid-associated protein YgaU
LGKQEQRSTTARTFFEDEKGSLNMPVQETDDKLTDQVLRQQKEKDLKAKVKEAADASRQRLEEAKERIRARGRQAKKTYTVQAGDTLGKIAQELYGDGSRWTEIYEANKDKIADPNVIEVGQKLQIP